MEKVTELIIIAVDVIVTALVMVIAFTLYSQGQNLSNFVSSNINTSADQIAQMKYAKYEDMTLSGSEVLSFCRKYGSADDLYGCLVVYKNVDGSTTERGKKLIVEKDAEGNETRRSSQVTPTGWTWDGFQNVPSKNTYINPAASFSVTTDKNPNTGLIDSIKFTMEKYLPPVSASDLSLYSMNEGNPVAAQDVSNADLYTGHNASGSIDSSSSTESFAEQEESSKDLDVLFSDSKKQKETDAGGWTLSVVTNKIDDLTDDLVSVKSKLAQLSAETIDQSMVNALLNDLHSIEKSISEIKSKCKNSSELTDADRTTVYSSLKSLEDSVISVKSSVQELNTSLSEDVVEESEEVTR